MRIKHKPQRNAAAAEAPTKKPFRHKPGVVALREIRKLQRTTDPIIPLRPFGRLVRELTMVFNNTGLRWEAAAVLALREASEAYLVGIFEETVLCAVHAKRVTVMPCDLRLVMAVRDQVGKQFRPPPPPPPVPPLIVVMSSDRNAFDE
jgi:histone H3